MRTALVLAGAVAKGAYEAGVLAVLAEKQVEVSAIVATSAGALNAAVYASGVRCARPERAAEVLAELWSDEAEWRRIASFDWRDVIGLKGVSSTAPLEQIMVRGMQRVLADAAEEPLQEVHVRFVATSLSGEKRERAGISSTTFERLLDIPATEFDSLAGLQRVARAAAASAAFPVLYAPVELPEVGFCVDGGVVNNTPISWAIEAGAERVIVVTGDPEQEPDPAGAQLLGKEVDIAINERLFRDLLQARRVNQKLAEVQTALQALPLNDTQRASVVSTLGWRPLEITEIRPGSALRGSAFSALSDRALRLEYLEIGRAAARQALA